MAENTFVPFIHLTPADGHKKVMVETSEEDRFFVSVTEAITACKSFSPLLEAHRQIQLELSKVRAMTGEWIQRHGSDVQEAYLMPQNNKLLFLVVMKGKEFNSALEDDLTDLDLAVAQDSELHFVRMNVLAVPSVSKECVQSFLTAHAQ